jgi:hypothetical protein
MVTFPSFYVRCTAQNGAPYSASVTGFTTTVTPAKYDAPLSYTLGYTTIDFSTTKLTQTQVADVLSGAVSR